jgi:aspartyl-tRNA synthetase
MLRTHYCDEVTEQDYGKRMSVAGWVEDVRNLGGIAFVVLRDCRGRLQLTLIKKQYPDLFTKVTVLNRESVLAATGTCQQNDKVMNGWELLPDEVRILARAQAPLPMGVVDRVNVDFDTRLDNRIIDLRRDEVRAIFAVRHVFLGSAAEYLRKHTFTEVHTPNISAASSEGGTEVFKIDYFGAGAYLVQSPQLYKQMLMASGIERVYEIAWYFRAEGHDTSRHLNESTAVDIEMAFVRDERDVMAIAEGLTDHALQSLLSECSRELDLLGVELDPPALPYVRIPYDEVVEILQCAGDFSWGDDLGTDEENLLARHLDDELYFITDFPLEIKPFYVMPADDERYARAFDLEFRGMEIASGAQRIHQYDLLLQRMRAHGMNADNFKDYLAAFRYGMPPHGGFGYGIERFLMRALNLDNIRECILFPRDRKRIRP